MKPPNQHRQQLYSGLGLEGKGAKATQSVVWRTLDDRLIVTLGETVDDFAWDVSVTLLRRAYAPLDRDLVW